MSSPRTLPAARRRSLIGVALCAAVLGGCASPGEHLGGDLSRSDRADGGVMAADPLLADGRELRVVGTYAAASGRVCRRLATADGVVVARVSCRQADGRWTLGRSLGDGMPGTASSPDAGLRSSEPAARAGVRTVAPVLGGEPRAPDRTVVSERLRSGETLWGFATRVTGEPRNWQRIAEINGIEDVSAIEAGRSLRVPASMLASGR